MLLKPLSPGQVLVPSTRREILSSFFSILFNSFPICRFPLFCWMSKIKKKCEIHFVLTETFRPKNLEICHLATLLIFSIIFQFDFLHEQESENKGKGRVVYTLQTGWFCHSIQCHNKSEKVYY